MLRTYLVFMGEVDELQRRMQSEAMLIALATVGFSSFAWGFLEEWAQFPHIPLIWVLPAIIAVWGVAVAFVFVQSRLVEVSLFPYAIVLQVTPIVAIAPLIIIWVKDPIPAMVICATIVALFPIISNTILGLRSVNPGLKNLFKLNRATRWQTLMRLRVPSALPFFFGGLRISSGLALIGAVVAEFVAGTGGTQSGLAYQILQSGFQLNIPRLFAALLLITATGIVLFMAMAWLSKLALSSWHESEMDR